MVEQIMLTWFTFKVFICHWIFELDYIEQHGPTTFDLLAILQTLDNSRATSSKMIYKKIYNTTDSKLKKGS